MKTEPQIITHGTGADPFFARAVDRSNTRFVATTDDPIGYWRTDGLDAAGTNLWGGGVAPIRARRVR